jgi:hypothetical protein
MKSRKPSLDPELAWALWHGLAKLSDLLWKCYKDDFVKLAREERKSLGQDSEEDLEIPF